MLMKVEVPIRLQEIQELVFDLIHREQLYLYIESIALVIVVFCGDTCARLATVALSIVNTLQAGKQSLEHGTYGPSKILKIKERVQEAAFSCTREIRHFLLFFSKRDKIAHQHQSRRRTQQSAWMDI